MPACFYLHWAYRCLPGFYLAWSQRFKLRELPATRSSDYLAFTRAVESDESQLVAIENSATGTRDVPASATADDLVMVKPGGGGRWSGRPLLPMPLGSGV